MTKPLDQKKKETLALEKDLPRFFERVEMIPFPNASIQLGAPNTHTLRTAFIICYCCCFFLSQWWITKSWTGGTIKTRGNLFVQKTTINELQTELQFTRRRLENLHLLLFIPFFFIRLSKVRCCKAWRDHVCLFTTCSDATRRNSSTRGLSTTLPIIASFLYSRSVLQTPPGSAHLCRDA